MTDGQAEELLNSLNESELKAQAAEVGKDSAKCQISRKLTAEWVGGTRAQIHSSDGNNNNPQLYIGGDQDFDAMSAMQASLLACEVDVIATHATLHGIELEKLTVEGDGEFNIARYMGDVKGPDPGYQKIGYTIKIKAKNATPEQLQNLAKICQTASPVGDSLIRSVAIAQRIIIE